MIDKKLPGINVQQPWARLLLSGEKTIETRTYPITDKYINQDMWLIETPGKEGGFRARVIGRICFSGSKEYHTQQDFYNDSRSHLIDKSDLSYAWKEGKRKFGWIVKTVAPISQFTPPFPRGIVYVSPFSREVILNE